MQHFVRPFPFRECVERFFGIIIIRMKRKDGGGSHFLDRVHEVPARFSGIRSCDGRANPAIFLRAVRGHGDRACRRSRPTRETYRHDTV